MEVFPALRYFMLMIVFSCQRCNEQQIPTASRLLRDFLSNKFRFIHSNTDTRQRSRSEKTTGTPRVNLVITGVTLSVFKHWYNSRCHQVRR